MKRIAAILTSLVLVFSLAACGSQQAGTAAGSEAASTASSETAHRQALRQLPSKHLLLRRASLKMSFSQRKTIF